MLKTIEVLGWVVTSGLFFVVNCISAYNYFRGVK